MSSGYRHLTYSDRCRIYELRKRGFSQYGIAMEIGCSQSTVCREIKRNTGQRGYRHKQAQVLAENRRTKASSLPRKDRRKDTEKATAESQRE